MSRTDKNLPYDVAYRRVTGRDQTITTETHNMTIEDILAAVRDGENFYENHPSYRSLIVIGFSRATHEPGQTIIEKSIPKNSVERTKRITVYPSRQFHEGSQKIIPRHLRDERVSDNKGFVAPENTEVLATILHQMGIIFDSDDINISTIKQNSYHPFQFDGDTSFYTVHRRSVIDHKNDLYGSPSAHVFIITIYRAEKIIPVTTTYTDMYDTTREEDRIIGRLSFNHPSHYYDYEHPRRRTRERDSLIEITKDFNTNGEIEELDDYHVDIPDRQMDNYHNTPEWKY